MSKKSLEQYRDMLDLTRPLIPGHPPLSRESRAAQFSPFAALTGYEELIEEGARFTEEKSILGEEALEELNRSLTKLPRRIAEKEKVELLYFEKDPLKAGGQYLSYQGRVVKMDAAEEWIRLEDGKTILFENIVKLS